MAQDNIPKNQIKSRNTIEQREHEDDAAARRVVSVDQNGDFQGPSNPTPTIQYFIRDGVPQAVNEDTGNPNNNRPLPVKLTGFDGDVNINAENLNLEVQLDGLYDASTNTNPDTIGVTQQTRAVTAARANQVQRPTAKRGTTNTDTVSGDVAIHDHSGNSFALSNPLASQISNGSSAADFNKGASGAATLRVSANITRDGNELAYGSGASDVNTQRVILATDQPAILVTGPLTDTQLRASPVPVSGPLTDTQLRATPVPVSGPLTDSQLRATPVPVSGTVTANQGTSPWVVSGTVTANIGTTGGLALNTTVAAPQGSASGGTAGTVSQLAGGIFNTSPPVLTNGQQAALQLDASGNLKTTATATISGSVSVTQGTSPWVENVAQFGGNNVVTGTGPSGLGIPRITLANDSNILVTQSGTWNLNNISGTISLPTGAATAALQTAGNSSLSSIDGKLPATLGQKTMANSFAVVLASDQTAIPVSQSGIWSVGRTWALASGTDSVAAVQSGIWNITNISGTISLPTGAATSALQTTGNAIFSSIDGHLDVNLSTRASETTVAKLTLSQGSTTSGQQGPLMQGAVTTTAPTYTTAQTSPLSLTTAGALRVDNSANVQPVSQSGIWNLTNISGTISLPTGAATAANQATANASLSSIDGKTPTLGQKTMANSSPVVIASDQTSIPFERVSQEATNIVTASNVVATLLAANADRKGATFYNNAGRNVYIKFGTGATTSSFKVRLQDNDYYEMPLPVYTGIITVITAAGSGPVNACEDTL